MKEYFTIGDMAEYSGLSAKKLRYYDEMGILSPRHKGPKSGYRYYTFTEFEKSILLKTMRDLDYSLEQIKNEFEKLTPERYLELLKYRSEDITNKVQKLQQMQRFLRGRVMELETVISMPRDRCFVTPIQSLTGIIYPIQNQSSEGLRQKIREIEKEQNDGANIALILRMISKEDLESGKLTDYSYFFVILNNFTGFEDKIQVIPEQNYAVTYCPVPKHKSSKCWKKLLGYIEESDYEICGDGIKRIVIEQGVIMESNEYVSMLGIPVKKKDSSEAE